MSNKATTKSKSNKNKQAEPASELTFPYEFLDMLIDTSLIALSQHLKETGATKEAELLDMTYCLMLHQLRMLEGAKQDIASLGEDVASVVCRLSQFEKVEWFSPTGRVIPIKERELLFARVPNIIPR